MINVRHRIICGSCGQELNHLSSPAPRVDRKSWAVTLALTAGCSVILVVSIVWAFA